MIKYLGSKRVLIPSIVEQITALPNTRSVIDLFSGTSRVGHALKRANIRVLANDHNAYASTIAKCYVQADADDVLADAARWIDRLNALPGTPGWFTTTYAEASRFFQPHNTARIEAVRDAIAAAQLPDELEAVLLVALMEAADRVDSTTGVQMAYLKQWAPRAKNPLALRVPDVLPRAAAGKGAATALDAVDAARVLSADVAYLDPPYNGHKYLGNYHIWETLVRWDHPEVYGIANKRVDCRDRKSAFNARGGILPALTSIVESLDVRHLVVSFSDEGFVSRDEMVALLSKRGPVRVVSVDHPRYVGAKIGIYNPKGEKVGKVGALKNREHLFIV